MPVQWPPPQLLPPAKLPRPTHPATKHPTTRLLPSHKATTTTIPLPCHLHPCISKVESLKKRDKQWTRAQFFGRDGEVTVDVSVFTVRGPKSQKAQQQCHTALSDNCFSTQDFPLLFRNNHRYKCALVSNVNAWKILPCIFCLSCLWFFNWKSFQCILHICLVFKCCASTDAGSSRKHLDWRWFKLYLWTFASSLPSASQLKHSVCMCQGNWIQGNYSDLQLSSDKCQKCIAFVHKIVRSKYRFFFQIRRFAVIFPIL